MAILVWNMYIIQLANTIISIRCTLWFLNIAFKCRAYILNKIRKGREHGLLGHLGPAAEPYQIISFDTISELGNIR